MSRHARLVVPACLLALAFGLVPPVPAASAGSVTGAVLDGDGRPAVGHLVLLFDAQGREVGRAMASASGRYAIPGVPRGSYAMAVETPEGTRAAVASAPLAVGGGRLRINLRLLEQGDEVSGVVASTGEWWSGLSTAGKVWVVTGTAALTAIAIAGLDDDDETLASPTVP